MPERRQEESVAFIDQAKPYLEELRSNAAHHLAYHEARGDLEAGQLAPDEIVGEALIRAFEGRSTRPGEVPLRTWLLGVQARVVDEILEQNLEQRELWAFSLDEPLPRRFVFDPHNPLWSWDEPGDANDAGDAADQATVRVAPVAREAVARIARQLKGVRRKQWQAWLLFDAHRLGLSQVASVLRETVGRAAQRIRRARAALADSSAEPATGPSRSREQEE